MQIPVLLELGGTLLELGGTVLTSCLMQKEKEKPTKIHLRQKSGTIPRWEDCTFKTLFLKYKNRERD